MKFPSYKYVNKLTASYYYNIKIKAYIAFFKATIVSSNVYFLVCSI